MRKSLLLFTALFFSLCVFAQQSKSVSITAGSLESSITKQEAQTITDLTISGTLDIRDFLFLNDSMPNIKHLDISSTSVEAYTGMFQFDPEEPAEEYGFYANVIPGNAFADCDSLLTIKLPSNIVALDGGVFNSCDNLQYINIPNSVESIGNIAFFGCKNIQYIILPSALEEIGTNAFIQCDKMKYMVIKTSSPDNLMVSGPIFYYIEIADAILYVPAGSKSNYKTGEWNSFGAIIEGNPQTGIKENQLENISINQQDNSISIQGLTESAHLTVSDMYGKIILSQTVNSIQKVSISALPQGVYIIKLATDKGEVVKKILKK